MLSAGTAIGMQYLTGTWVFAKPTPDTPGYASTRALSDNFDLWKHELLDAWTQNNIYNGTQNVVSGAPSWSTINIHYWWWTDATPFVSWREFSLNSLQGKVDSIVQEIDSMNLSSTNAQIFKDELANIRLWTWVGTNWYLQNARQAEFIEQTARALSDSWKWWDCVVSLIHDTWLDVVWTHTHDIWERVVNWMIEVTKAPVPWQPAKTWWRWLMGAPTFFNTFKDREAA